MSKKMKRIFIAFCTIALVFSTATTAFATDDPLQVVNNLSEFIFGLIRAIGMILLAFGIVQVGLSLKSHDPSQRANGFLTLFYICLAIRNHVYYHMLALQLIPPRCGRYKSAYFREEIIAFRHIVCTSKNHNRAVIQLLLVSHNIFKIHFELFDRVSDGSFLLRLIYHKFVNQ